MCDSIILDITNDEFPLAHHLQMSVVASGKVSSVWFFSSFEYTTFSKKLKFVIERPMVRLGHTLFKYLGPKFLCSLPDNLKK